MLDAIHLQLARLVEVQLVVVLEFVDDLLEGAKLLRSDGSLEHVVLAHVEGDLLP